MRKLLIIFVVLSPFIGVSQINFPQINGEEDWEKVIITRNPDDVKGLQRVGSVEGKASALYGGQRKLRKKATEKIKREAAKQGASIVLISLDNFAMSPVNNVQMQGTAYRNGGGQQASNGSEGISTSEANPVNNIELPVIKGEEDWKKVIITRNPDDVKGLHWVASVSGHASALYGGQGKLRKKATQKIKKEAAKQGAPIVLITLDNFAMSPINNVQLEGTAYKAKE